MKKILVTGASGFIGKRLVARLLSEGWDVIGLGRKDGDVASPDTFRMFADKDFFHVFHLAGKTYVPDSWNDPVSFHQTNVLGTANVLEFCRKEGYSLTFVSAYLYGKPEKLPIAESDLVRPNNPYALSKYLAEKLCEFYSEFHDVPISVARPFNVYGPGQDEKFLIPTIIKQVLHSDAIVVKDLAPKRDYLYLDDLIDGLLKTISERKGYAVYNFGTGVSFSVEEVINVVQEVAKTDKPVRCDSEIRSGEILDVTADISKAMNVLDWNPQYTFQQGIQSILNFNMANTHD